MRSWNSSEAAGEYSVSCTSYNLSCRGMFRSIRYLPVLALIGLIGVSCSSPRTQKFTPDDCKVCERIELFSLVRQSTADMYWKGFDDTNMIPPLVYFSDSLSWLAFADASLFNQFSSTALTCPNGTRLYKYAVRLDSIPFHMENKMDFSDSTRPMYFNPIMYCSDVETASALIPEVQHTEEWMQMVMHEYFHGFQFRHPACIRYLADSVKIMTDSLHAFYTNLAWFRQALEKENALLLQAFADSTQDDRNRSIRTFLDVRKQRRQQFREKLGFDIRRDENFWEKIEGSARYMEYNAGFIFHTLTRKPVELKHDSLFNQWKDYITLGFIDRPWFADKTQIMTAYYYVTGFNICRLLDKLDMEYKPSLFDEPGLPLDHYLEVYIQSQTITPTQ